MKKRHIIRMICMILLAVSLMTVISCDEEDCETSGPLSAEDLLQEYVRYANGRLSNYCLHSDRTNYGHQSGLTREGLNENLFNFVYIQEKYSGKKLCTIEETTYNYPKYTAVWENRDQPVTESTRYYIEELGEDEIGLYTGIRIIPYDSGAEEKIKAMNVLVKQHNVFSTRKTDLDKVHEAYKSFQSKYSGSLLHVDKITGEETYCPDYFWTESKPDMLESDMYNYILVYVTKHPFNCGTGFNTGIIVDYLDWAVSDNYRAKTGEIISWRKSMSHKYEEEPVDDPDALGPIENEAITPDTYMMPNLTIKLD